jgi:retron-type reverse transcriptase
MSKYENLKSYLQTHYNFHANLGQYNLGDREQLETEAKWRMISDIMDYVDNLDSEDNVIKFPKTDDATVSLNFQII